MEIKNRHPCITDDCKYKSLFAGEWCYRCYLRHRKMRPNTVAVHLDDLEQKRYRREEFRARFGQRGEENERAGLQGSYYFGQAIETRPTGTHILLT